MIQSAPNFNGIITALITPFGEDGKIDFNSFEKLLDFQLQQDIDGFVVNGTTAESPTLTPEEVEKLISATKKKLETSGRRRVLIVGTGSNSTANTIEATKRAQDMGADAALVVVPYYNKPPQRGLVAHYKSVAESTKIPILLYNVPGRTITSMTSETIRELSQVDNIVGVKEATGDMKFGQEVLNAVAKDFVVTSGDDGTFLQLAKLGGKGTISVCSHIIGQQMRGFLSRVLAGDEGAFKDYDRYQNFISQLYTEANPIAVKMALYLMGVIKTPELRLPLVALDQKYVAGLKSSMREVGLIHD